MENTTMKAIRTTILIATLLLSEAAFAEDAHHPADDTNGTATTTEQPAQPKPPAAGNMTGGMTSGSMMTGGMMSGPMMSGGMMSDGMMNMMMGMMSGNDGPMGMMMSPDYVEGRIAFLHAELKLTDQQEGLWGKVADALRANAGAAKEMKSTMKDAMGTTDTLLQRIGMHERILSTRLQGLQRLKTALEPFYAQLDEQQKAVADRLLLPAPMGMM
jgi:hypothetical protein